MKKKLKKKRYQAALVALAVALYEVLEVVRDYI
jgi:putative effector of murein hydrolase